MDAIEVPSKLGRHPVYMYRLENGECIEWVYQKKRARGGAFYECGACKRLRLQNHTNNPEMKIPRTQIMDGKFLTDPLHPGNPHFCKFKGIGGALGQRGLYNLTQKIRSNPPPDGSYRVIYEAALNSVQKSVGPSLRLSEEQKEEMEAVMIGNGGYRSKRSSLLKAAKDARAKEAAGESAEEVGKSPVTKQPFSNPLPVPEFHFYGRKRKQQIANIKWRNGDEIRRFRIELLPERPFRQLITEMRKIVPHFKGQLAWIDEFGDAIRLDTDTELQAALSCPKNKDLLEIYTVEVEESQSAQPAEDARNEKSLPEVLAHIFDHSYNAEKQNDRSGESKQNEQSTAGTVVEETSEAIATICGDDGQLLEDEVVDVM